MASQESTASNVPSRSRSFGDPALVDAPRAVGSPHVWRAAWIGLLEHLGRSTGAFAAEFGARCAINHLRSLDDNRLRDLGLERDGIERFVRVDANER